MFFLSVGLDADQLDLQRVGEAGRDLILQSANIGQRAIELIGPELRGGRRFKQLDVDP